MTVSEKLANFPVITEAGWKWVSQSNLYTSRALQCRKNYSKVGLKFHLRSPFPVAQYVVTTLQFQFDVPTVFCPLSRLRPTSCQRKTLCKFAKVKNGKSTHTSWVARWPLIWKLGIDSVYFGKQWKCFHQEKSPIVLHHGLELGHGLLGPLLETRIFQSP